MRLRREAKLGAARRVARGGERVGRGGGRAARSSALSILSKNPSRAPPSRPRRSPRLLARARAGFGVWGGGSHHLTALVVLARGLVEKRAGGAEVVALVDQRVELLPALQHAVDGLVQDHLGLVQLALNLEQLVRLVRVLWCRTREGRQPSEEADVVPCPTPPSRHAPRTGPRQVPRAAQARSLALVMRGAVAVAAQRRCKRA